MARTGGAACRAVTGVPPRSATCVPCARPLGVHPPLAEPSRGRVGGPGPVSSAASTPGPQSGELAVSHAARRHLSLRAAGAPFPPPAAPFPSGPACEKRSPSPRGRVTVPGVSSAAFLCTWTRPVTGAMGPVSRPSQRASRHHRPQLDTRLSPAPRRGDRVAPRGLGAPRGPLCSALLSGRSASNVLAVTVIFSGGSRLTEVVALSLRGWASSRDTPLGSRSQGGCGPPLTHTTPGWLRAPGTSLRPSQPDWRLFQPGAGSPARPAPPHRPPWAQSPATQRSLVCFL